MHIEKIILPTLVFASFTLYAQTGDLRLLDWQPKSQLVVKETKIVKPRYPVIDIHNHLRDLSKTNQYLKEMDKAGVWICIGLDGLSENDFYKAHLAASQAVSKERFCIFFAPDFTKIDELGFGQKEVRKLEDAVRLGAKGLQIYKALGLTTRDKNGKLIAIDDPRIDPIWDKCAELGIPVMIHSSDPKAFHVGPVDRYNERYEELSANPSWAYYGTDVPPKEDLLAQRNRVIERHPNTIFIAAHIANLSEDLGRVGMWIDKYPNLYVDIDARINELGRQPYSARKFMIRYQDRILFGSDTAPNAEAYRVHYRFLETDDEYFDPAPGHKFQGRWMIYGLHLPDEALEKIYYRNAMKLLNLSTP
jgi:predicted TIM-barrel fold metal-dependent hydrolase